MRTDDSLCDVIVIGAGISGLAAAWRLKGSGVDVCVLEAHQTAGGAMRSEQRDGFLLEKVPFGVTVREPVFEKLLEELDEEIRVIAADPSSARGRYVLHGGCLHRIPSNPTGLLGTPLLSPAGKLRLIRGLVASRPARGEEESVHDAAARRLGGEVAERLVSALCVCIFAGDSRDLSLAGCFPALAAIDRRARSPLGLALRQKLPWKRRQHARSRPRWRGLISFRGGLGSLPGALGRALGCGLLTNCTAQSLKRSGPAYLVRCTTAGGRPLELRCRRLLLAVPAAAACALLGPLAPRIGALIKAVPAASLVVLNLGFQRRDVGHPLDGYGFLVPATEPFPLLGVLWADRVFPHHAPPGRRLLRVFMGGTRRPDLLARDDGELVEIAVAALAPLLRLSRDPILVDVCRWTDAIPQYTPGHVQRVGQIRRLQGELPGLELIGNYLDGVSINDCVRNAVGAADRILQDLRTTGAGCGASKQQPQERPAAP